MLASLGYEDILKILPECLVLLEVELYGHLAAFGVGDELDSRHAYLLSSGSDNLARPSGSVNNRAVDTPVDTDRF
jgi:hypothetical protein